MATACSTGLLYFLAVFTFAFAMGVARELVVAPWLGSTAAVLLEIPVILVASWIVAHRLLRHRSLTLMERAAMGVTAFTLTMASEAGFSVLLRVQSVTDWAAAVATPLGLVGLVGQIVFATIPIFVNPGRIDTAPTV